MFDARTDTTTGLPQWARMDERQRSLVRSFASLIATEPDAGAGPAMGRWLRDRATVQAALDGRGLAVAGAFEASGAWGLDGYRSARCWLVDNTGAARIATGAALKTARLARTMPHVRAAMAAGELAADKVHWLVRARTDEVAEVFDRDEAELVAQARLLSIDAFRAELLRWRLRALEELGRNEPDGDPPLPEGEADRLHLHATVGGRGVMDGELDPASRAIVFGAIDAEIDGWFRRGELEGDERTQVERNAKAFLDIFLRGIAAGSAHGGPRPLIIATADIASLAELGILFDLHGVDPASIDLSRLDLSALTPAPGHPVDLHAVIRAVLDLLLGHRPDGGEGGGGDGGDGDGGPVDPPDGAGPSASDRTDEDEDTAEDDAPLDLDPAPSDAGADHHAGPPPSNTNLDRADRAAADGAGPPPPAPDHDRVAGRRARPRPHGPGLRRAAVRPRRGRARPGGTAPPRHRRTDRSGRPRPSRRGPPRTNPPPALAPDLRPTRSIPPVRTRSSARPRLDARPIAADELTLGPRRAEVVGVGPVPLRTVGQLVRDAHVTLVARSPDGHPLFATTRRRTPTSPSADARISVAAEPLALQRRQRLASNAQWRALLVRSGGTCEILGCPVVHQRCRAHHLDPWEHGGPTDLSNLLLVCTHHHATLHAGFTAQPAPRGGHQLRRPDGTPVPVPYRDRLVGCAGAAPGHRASRPNRRSPQ